jgi:hypothetical protein
LTGRFGEIRIASTTALKSSRLSRFAGLELSRLFTRVDNADADPTQQFDEIEQIQMSDDDAGKSVTASHWPPMGNGPARLFAMGPQYVFLADVFCLSFTLLINIKPQSAEKTRRDVIIMVRKKVQIDNMCNSPFPGTQTKCRKIEFMGAHE